MGPSYVSGVSRLASRSRMLLRRRGSGRSLGSRWPLVPAADVPNSLINQVGRVTDVLMSCDSRDFQAMAVLQGKSRDAVIRELQRTVSPISILSCSHSYTVVLPFLCSHPQNLDVNQAVNNLLSRDDDDDGGEGEGSEGEPLIPAAFFPSGGTHPHTHTPTHPLPPLSPQMSC